MSASLLDLLFGYYNLKTNYNLCLQLHDKYHDFVTAAEKEDFIAKLQETEDWLYEDGEDETKGVYVAKLEELKKVILVLHLISQVDYKLHI